LAETTEVKRSIRRCSVCNNLTDVDPCHFCTHPSRSDKLLCIVEESNNILPVEKTHSFNGRYHVLMGSISPLRGVTPDQLGVPSLIERLKSGTVEEVIVATNPNVEGETTALYLSFRRSRLSCRRSRIRRPWPPSRAAENFSRGLRGLRGLGTKIRTISSSQSVIRVICS
jgi:recombination protein RecR